MKKINVEAISRDDVKIIGSIEALRSGTLCLVSEKNLISILKTLGNIPAADLANKIANRLERCTHNDDFTVVTLQSILNEEMDYIQFAVDCGDLLIGDTTKIDEFLSEKPKPKSAGYNESKVL